MGKSKELSEFSNLTLIQELRNRGLAVTAYDAEDLEDVGVKPKDRKTKFKAIREDLCEEAKKKQNTSTGKLYRVWVSKTSHKVVVVKARSKKEAEKAAKKSVEQDGILGDEMCFSHPHDIVDSIESALPTDTPDYVAVKRKYGIGYELEPVGG